MERSKGSSYFDLPSVSEIKRLKLGGKPGMIGERYRVKKRIFNCVCGGKYIKTRAQQKVCVHCIKENE